VNGVNIGIDNVFKVRCQGCAINSWPTAGLAHAFGDVEDDTGKSIFVEVDFLVVGDLTDGAGNVSMVVDYKKP
jgi:hypothetical protein